jgi:tetratricopeptide (TPR) repeat protein
MHTFAALIAAVVAQAASPQPAPNPAAKAKAQAILKQGSALFEQGDYQSALDKFEEAYAAFPSPKLQFNIAQADRALGRPVDALKAFETFVSLAPDASPEALSDARKSILELRSRLGQIDIECSPTESTVTIDGKAVGTAPVRAPIWAEPGHHQVTIEHRGFTPAIESAEVIVGKIQHLTIKLKSSTAPPPAAVTLAPSPAPTASVDLTTSPGQPTAKQPAYRAYFWAGAGTTAALAVGAVVSGLMTNSMFSDLQNTCGKTTPGCSESQIDSVKTRAHVTNALWALTGVAAVATGVVFYIDNRETGAALSWMF